jgi:ATP phosphoribosyltransferase regulatory subunit
VANRERWLLPDGVDELLPPAAARLEHMRRTALDLLATWGYRLCIPPMVEFLDSLLSGAGDDLELQTFKLTDQISGRMLGIPADITPQIARIDAHRMSTDAPQRLCYVGPILHTRPDKFAGSRNPLQIGAELYGHAGIESDAEVVCLMSALLVEVGVRDCTLELGHMGIFRGLIAAANLTGEHETELLDALLRKARTEVDEVMERAGVSPSLMSLFRALLDLNGDAARLADARDLFQAAPAPVKTAVSALEGLINIVRARVPGLNVHIDLAELRGYHYHTGVMFAAYTPRLGRAVAWGGRYDNIGVHFGRARPATGFSTDLKLLAAIGDFVPTIADAVFAPAVDDAALASAINALRTRGTVVIQALPGQLGSARDLGCARQLVCEGGSWHVTNS